MIVLTILLLISSQLPTRATATISYLPRSFIALISKPAVLLQRLSTTLRPPHDQTDNVFASDDLARQLAQAYVYIDNLEQEVQELRQLSESLTQIDALLGHEDIRLAGASVLGFNGNKKNPVITIGIGSDDGVRDGLAVVWGANLVGKVVNTSAKTADVKLITAAGTHLQVRIVKQTPDGPGAVMPAYIEMSNDGQSFVTEEFPVDSPIAVGDVAHLADDSWQFRSRGFIVGVVTEVGKSDRPLLNSRVVIKPLLSLATLPRVVVLVPRD